MFFYVLIIVMFFLDFEKKH